MDYIGLSRILSFAACETRQCVNVTIVDDLVDEPVEEFYFSLERTMSLDSRISLRPVDTRVIMHDNEGKCRLIVTDCNDCSDKDIHQMCSNKWLTALYYMQFSCVNSSFFRVIQAIILCFTAYILHLFHWNCHHSTFC